MKIKTLEKTYDACMFAGGEKESGIPTAWIRVGNFDFSPDGECVIVPNENKNQTAEKGDYIVKTMNNKFFVITAEAFQGMYEPAGK